MDSFVCTTIKAYEIHLKLFGLDTYLHRVRNQNYIHTLIHMYDFDGRNAETYTEECKECNTKIQVSANADEDDHSYVYNVFVACHNCGESVHFELPAYE